MIDIFIIAAQAALFTNSFRNFRIKLQKLLRPSANGMVLSVFYGKLFCFHRFPNTRFKRNRCSGGFRTFATETVVYGFPVIDDEAAGLFCSGTFLVCRDGIIGRMAAGRAGQIHYLTAAAADQMGVGINPAVKPFLAVHNADRDDRPFFPE
jgi:hypothetical protein